MKPETWMKSSPEAMGWGFLELEKNSWDSTLEEGSWFSGARRGQTSSLRRGAARGRVRWKSQHSKKLCLSLLVSKNLEIKKVNKSFVPEQKESSQCFVYFGIPYVYFTYSYLGRIFVPTYIKRYSYSCLWLLKSLFLCSFDILFVTGIQSAGAIE